MLLGSLAYICLLLAFVAAGHVIEEAREPSSGIQILTGLRNDWKVTTLANHITWHLALLYLGQEFLLIFCFLPLNPSMLHLSLVFLLYLFP